MEEREEEEAEEEEEMDCHDPHREGWERINPPRGWYVLEDLVLYGGGEEVNHWCLYTFRGQSFGGLFECDAPSRSSDAADKLTATGAFDVFRTSPAALWTRRLMDSPPYGSVALWTRRLMDSRVVGQSFERNL